MKMSKGQVRDMYQNQHFLFLSKKTPQIQAKTTPLSGIFGGIKQIHIFEIFHSNTPKTNLKI